MKAVSSYDPHDRLILARQLERRSAWRGAFWAAALFALLVVALGVVVDLDVLWLAGLVVLGFVGLSLARPLRLRIDWTDHLGVGLVTAGGVVAVVAYVMMQFLARSIEWTAPNTLSGFAAALVIFAICLPALARLATRGTAAARQQRGRDV